MATIGIFDSGSGGLSVYREIKALMPHDRCIYYSDNANCPYGEKNRDFIISRARFISDLLISKGADIIVIACNTATAAAIATLRAEYSIPFVGMEPAVKPAALGTRSGVIGVLATAGTLSASKYLDTRDRFTEGIRVVEHVGKGFVELVESLELDGENAYRIVKASLSPLLEAGADTVVLGCTHYPFLLPVMEKVALDAGADIRFIDPAPAVARQVQKVLTEKGIGPAVSGEPDTELLASGPADTLQKLFSLIY